MNPFSPEKIYNRIMDFNPFRPKTKEDILDEKKHRLSRLEELKELSEMAEQLIADSRYIKLRKLRQEQLDINMELLKTTKSTDPRISELQASVQRLEEELDMVKLIRNQIERIENEPATEA